MNRCVVDREEWELMWRKLGERPGAHGDVADLCPCCGEVWQYMGTGWRLAPFGHPCGGWVHTFRHRHGRTELGSRSRARVNVSVAASWEFVARVKPAAGDSLWVEAGAPAGVAR